MKNISPLSLLFQIVSGLGVIAGAIFKQPSIMYAGLLGLMIMSGVILVETRGKKEFKVERMVIAGVIVIAFLVILVTSIYSESEKKIETFPIETFQNIHAGDFIRYGGEWYPVKQTWGEGKNITVQIRLVTHDILNMNKFYLTTYVDSIITIQDRDEWITAAKWYVIHN